MTIIQLLRIYHSFLLKKWSLFIYIFIIFTSVLIGIIIMSEKIDRDIFLKIAVVDEDNSKETQMILQTVGDGKTVGEQLKITSHTMKDAQYLLGNHQIDGYFIFEKGMTEQFYKNGELPIQVHTYDENSVQSIIINQLADTIYSRLMLSEAGIISYAKLNEKATEDELVTVMIDMLFVGLDRQASFHIQEVQSYNMYKYMMISIFFLLIYLFYWSISTIIQMNQSNTLKIRLMMYPLAQEKIVISRGIFSLMYTLIFTMIMMFFIYPYTALESYNIRYFILIVGFYLLSIFFVSTIVDLLKRPFLKLFLATFIIVLSGATIPFIYLKQIFISQQLFAQLFYALLELLHNNYIIDWTALFYWQLIAIIFIFITLLLYYWRRSQ